MDVSTVKCFPLVHHHKGFEKGVLKINLKNVSLNHNMIVLFHMTVQIILGVIH